MKNNETNFVSPLFVTLPRKTKADKKIYLNLNVYRNLHYISNNQAKEIYCEMMRGQMSGKKFERVEITFVYFKGRNCRVDRSNILSIVEKFFCDALVENGCLKDDNDDIIIETRYRSGGLDRNNGRVEITVAEV